MYKGIFTFEITINPILKSGISPQYEHAVKAMKVIECNDKEECIARVKDFLRKQGFTITKEVSSGSHGN